MHDLFGQSLRGFRSGSKGVEDGRGVGGGGGLSVEYFLISLCGSGESSKRLSIASHGMEESSRRSHLKAMKA